MYLTVNVEETRNLIFRYTIHSMYYTRLPPDPKGVVWLESTPREYRHRTTYINTHRYIHKHII